MSEDPYGTPPYESFPYELRVMNSSKHSSLLQRGVNYGRKKSFIVQAQGGNIVKRLPAWNKLLQRRYDIQHNDI